MASGKILVAWDHAGKLNIQTSLPINDSHGRKEIIEKLLDAARAVNNSGSTLVMPAPSGTQLLGGVT